MSSARRLVAANTAVQVAGKGVTLAIGLASIAIVTRYLGPDDYGRYTLALTYIQLFGVLADVGLFTIVVREISRRMRADLWDAVTAGKLKLPIDRRFPLDEAPQAHAHMRANAHFGKIVLTM